jgi:SAM-dependent methyltransferase
MTAERPYLDPYLHAAQAHGAGFEALLWQSPKAQRTRFRVISRMLNSRGRTVADIGCGNADLLLDLHRRKRTPAGYIGVDAVPQTLALAERQVRAAGIEHAWFQDDDFVRDAALPARLVERGADTIVFCGSLNTLSQSEALAVLARFWIAMADHPIAAPQDDTLPGVRDPAGALIFNFLSLRHNRERTPANPPAVRFEPLDMLAWAIERTPLVTFRHDYLRGHDATICMRTG